MKRTPLLLVFGEHGGRNGRLKIEPDKEFYKGLIDPFVEKHVVRGGKKAIVIHEYNTAINCEGLDNREVIEIMANLEKKILLKLEATFNCGLVMDENSMDWFDWGFMDRILEINREAPGTIDCVIEPLGASTQWIMWRQSMLSRQRRSARSFDESVLTEVEMIRGSIQVCIDRDKRLVEFVNRLRRENPDRAIIIPRGYAHMGMARDFDYLHYMKSEAARLTGAPWFSTEAIIEAFSREITPAELERYARLSLHYSEYYYSHMDEHLLNARLVGAEPAEGLRELTLNAREYAFLMESRNEAVAV
jgi:hypothetical protein